MEHDVVTTIQLQMEHDVVATIQDSQRCKLIADANCIAYKILSNQTDQEDRYLPYVERWQVYKELADRKEEEELNVAQNKERKSCGKSIEPKETAGKDRLKIV